MLHVSKRTAMKVEPFQQLLKAQTRITSMEAEPLVILPIYPKPSKLNLGLLPITADKSFQNQVRY